MQEGGEAESGVAPEDCHARLFSATAVCSDSVGAGGDGCCGREAPSATGEILGDTEAELSLFNGTFVIYNTRKQVN